MGLLGANVTIQLTSDTYTKLAISLAAPLILYVVLLVVTKNMR